MKHSFLTYFCGIGNKQKRNFIPSQKIDSLNRTLDHFVLDVYCATQINQKAKRSSNKSHYRKEKKDFFWFFECFYFWFVFINDLATEKLDCFKRNLWLNSLNLPKLSEQPIFAFQWFGTFWKKLVTCLLSSVVTVSQFFWPPKQLPTLPANRRRKNFWFLKFFENPKISLQSDQTRKKSKMGSNAPCKRCLVIPGPGKCLSKLFKMKPMLHWSQKLH